MLDLFSKKNKSKETAEPTTLSIQPLHCPFIKFDQFVKGIDNVHIDVHLSPRFTTLSRRLIYELLNERSSTKRRFTDKPSAGVIKKLDIFSADYTTVLTAAIHLAPSGKRIDEIQLFQIATIKFILTTVRMEADRLLYELRKASIKENKKNLKLSERIAWFNKNQNNLLNQVTHELFTQLLWVERSGPVKKMRESLLGVAWSIPQKVLSNPLLQSPDLCSHEVLMKHYVLLSQDPDSCYGFERLSTLINNLLDKIVNVCQIQITPDLENSCAGNQSFESGREIHFSWIDVTKNMDELFDLQKTRLLLEEESGSVGRALETKFKLQCQAHKILEQYLRNAQVIKHLLAAYQTPILYEHYAKLLKPYLLYQALCDEVQDSDVEFKLKNQLKIRPLRRPGDKPLHINELKKAKKRLTKSVRNPDPKILKRFITDFITYQRDLKYYRLMQEAMEQVNLLNLDSDVQLSRSNDMLHEFLEPSEQSDTEETIRCHVIIKADLRGSTTMTAELCRRGLNPATHFSRNFFNPIRQLLEDFGAEKVFIEGDAVILSLFEHQYSPDQWLATARACGLARSMLQVVHKQNEVSRTYKLPKLELGIGICYSPEAPKFLYDGDQRIMISPAIGDADRLSSCSWKLRHKYASKTNLLTHVMVFQQPLDDAFRGEKGMTTFRYNLNGIELDQKAFEKLQSEIVLRHLKICLPGDKHHTRFYVGYYSDVKEESHEVVIREGQSKVWQEDSDDYPLTNTLYYEVVTNKTILSAIKKLVF